MYVLTKRTAPSDRGSVMHSIHGHTASVTVARAWFRATRTTDVVECKDPDPESPLAKREKADEAIERMQSAEVERRQWCIQQACYLDETRPENLLTLADKIYEYVWGRKP